MRRATAAEVETAKVDSRNRPILSATKKGKSGRGSSQTGPGRSKTFNSMELLLSEEYKRTRASRKAGKPTVKSFPPAVLEKERVVGSPEPRYGRERMFEGQPHKPFHQQSAEEVRADSAAAAAAAAMSCKSAQVLAVEPLKDHLFDNDFLKLDMSQLPLSAYDAPELFDRASPREWIKTSGGRGFSPFQRNTSAPPEWTACTVLDYDDASKTFGIRFDSEGGFEKRVHRLRLTFEGEDRALFDKRRAFCEERQLADMQALRWKHFLSVQDKAAVPAVRKRIVMQILRRSHFDADAHSKHRTRSLIREVQDVYALDAMKVYCRQMFRRDGEWAAKRLALGLPSFPEKPPPPQRGKLDTGARPGSFKRAFSIINEQLIYNQVCSTGPMPCYVL